MNTVTSFKPPFLIKNEDQEIYDIVIKIVEIEEKEFFILKVGDPLLSNGGP